MGQDGRKDDGQLRSKGGGKLSIHYCANQDTITTVFRTITSANQLSLYGAVAEMCEEYDSFHGRAENPVVGGQSSSSFVPNVINTNVPLDGHSWDLDQKRSSILLMKANHKENGTK